MDNRLCPNCKKPLPENARFCMECGSRIDVFMTRKELGATFPEDGRGLYIDRKEPVSSPFYSKYDSLREKILNPDLAPLPEKRKLVFRSWDEIRTDSNDSVQNVSSEDSQNEEIRNESSYEEIAVEKQPLIYTDDEEISGGENTDAVAIDSDSEPETSEPEASKPEITESEITEPEITEPETSEPEITEPETSEPEIDESSAADESTEVESGEETADFEALKMSFGSDHEENEAESGESAEDEESVEDEENVEDEESETDDAVVEQQTEVMASVDENVKTAESEFSETESEFSETEREFSETECEFSETECEFSETECEVSETECEFSETESEFSESKSEEIAEEPEDSAAEEPEVLREPEPSAEVDVKVNTGQTIGGKDFKAEDVQESEAEVNTEVNTEVNAEVNAEVRAEVSAEAPKAIDVPDTFTAAPVPEQKSNRIITSPVGGGFERGYQQEQTSAGTMRTTPPTTAPAMYCGACGSRLKPGAKFCARCGHKVNRNSCPGCGYAAITEKMNFCPKCGYGLRHNRGMGRPI